MGPAFESSSYIFVTVFGVTIFKEKVGKRKLFALFLILLGIIIFTL
jgi:drug/metabolite transporter (DMT)-like permease